MNKPSLRRKLLQHVLWPLTLTWALGTAVTVGFAHYFSTQAYDRSLLDDAYALSAQVRSDSKMDASGNTVLNLNLTDAEMGSVLFDQSESIYFSVRRADGSLLAGHNALRPLSGVAVQTDASQSQSQIAWGDGVYLGKDVRIVSLTRALPAPHTVLVAQTTAARTKMLQQLLVMSTLPQLLLLLLLALWLRRRVGEDLQPLRELQNAVEQRDTHDLAPLAQTLAQDAGTNDMTRLGLAIDDLFLRLKFGVAAQREFSGNVAHELRTPLANIRLQAEHALTSSIDPVMATNMRQVLQSTDHASHLIDQLLALALADEAQNSVQLVMLDLSPLVRDVTIKYLMRADRLRVDLGAEGLDEPQTVRGNHALLEALLDNLLDNAFRYGLPKIDGEVFGGKITVRVTRKDEAIELSVTDNGTGLSDDEILQCMNRWKQAEAHQHIGQGVGLGLAIVARYAEVMGGVFTHSKRRVAGRDFAQS
jgi:two-component system, OmpR family, sensor histidine kinase TctE